MLPRLHVVTDDSTLRVGGWEDRATEVLEVGRRDVCLHLRGPRTNGATIVRLASHLLPTARRTGSRLFVNDRVDVALTMDLHGVHLGARSLPVSVARELLPSDRQLGVSVHGGPEAASFGREGADYAFLGTIFPTPTHPDVAGMGLDGLAAALSGLEDEMVIGIGGIDPSAVAGVLSAGAYGVAVARGVWAARDPVTAVRRYLEAIDKGARTFESD